MIRVGAFEMDDRGGIVGPAEYMADPDGFAQIKARMESGTSSVFNYACVGSSVESAALVATQTHYAEWLGRRQLAARFAVVRASQEATVAEVRAQRAREAATYAAKRRAMRKAGGA